MSASRKIVGAFASVGFFIPLVLLAYFKLSGTLIGEWFVHVCPLSVLWMGLARSTSNPYIAWLTLTCVSNAVLYALPGVGIAFLLSLRKSN